MEEPPASDQAAMTIEWQAPGSLTKESVDVLPPIEGGTAASPVNNPNTNVLIPQCSQACLYFHEGSMLDPQDGCE